MSPDNYCRRHKHTCDQNAECDVVETMCENVYGVVPAMSKIER
jgi:hypothetical protein